MQHIVFLDALTMGDMPDIQTLKEFGTLSVYDNTPKEEVVNRCKDATIIITNKVVLDAGVLSQLPHLKLICVAATGTNNVDLAKAEELNIPVKNVKGYSTSSVAQLTFGFIIELYNRIGYYNQYVKQGNYSSQQLFTHIGPGLEELAGKTMGIIGMGDIGKSVAAIARVFGMNVVYYSTSGKNNVAEYPSLSLEELLKKSDVVSIHAPLNDQTRMLIGLEQMKQMKASAILINVGRGGIVNEDDLVKALNEKIIHAAALDVFEKEPLSRESSLLKCEEDGRLILTPHIAWAGKNSRLKLLNGIKHNIDSFLKNIK